MYKRKSHPELIIIALIILALFAWRQGWFGQGRVVSPVDSLNFERDKPIIYTPEARCEMNCQEIFSPAVEDVIHNGKLDADASNPDTAPCPTFVLEGTTTKHQHVRVMIATCEDELRVISCTDMDQHITCACN
jgi:hypothetical protein